mmetsp:Transcript_20092/g.27708  ORF Transcript_20092/g.27708 Transcript_20092/m.27708 type:complete len:128 (-) Transcript_20092:102-485(-)
METEGDIFENFLEGGEKFRDCFFHLFDTRRHEVHNFYKENTILNWNGNMVRSTIPIRDFLIQLPASSHDVNTFDCQPIPGSDQLLIVAGGLVSFDGNPGRQFHQTFLLAKDPSGKYFVASHNLRTFE